MKGLLSCFLLWTFAAVTLAEDNDDNKITNDNTGTEKQINLDTLAKLKDLGTKTPLTSQTGMSGEQVIRDVKNHPEVMTMMRAFLVDIKARAYTRVTTSIPDAVGTELGKLLYVLGYKTALDGNTEIYYVRWAFYNYDGPLEGYSFIFHVKITVAMAAGKCHWNWSPGDLEANVKNARVVLVVGPKPDDTPIKMNEDFGDSDVIVTGSNMKTLSGTVLFDEFSKPKNIATLKSTLKPGEMAVKTGDVVDNLVLNKKESLFVQALALVKFNNPNFIGFTSKSLTSFAYILKGKDYYVRILIDGKFIFHLKLNKEVTAVKVKGPKMETEAINTNELST